MRIYMYVWLCDCVHPDFAGLLYIHFICTMHDKYMYVQVMYNYGIMQIYLTYVCTVYSTMYH